MISVNQQSSSLSFIEQQRQRQEEAQEQLSSARRINRAADDPAGLQISERLTSQINGDRQLSVNAQDQINLNNVQEASLSAISDSLQRANELSVQSGSAFNDPNAIQGELDQLTEQVNAIAGEALGDPNFLSGLDASDPAATQAALETAFESVSQQATALGADSNSLGSQVSTYETSVVNVSASRSRIQDTDFGQASSEQKQAEAQLQAAIITRREEDSRRGLLVNQLV
ncbi:flagellin [Thalassotalea euphylliae]|uniref:Flagellin n=1 Tax=Thalassotalea euphylliae TaxID=1655234 RepID=A0A3E0TV27_9GAMM|nr:flagellin [Thalassotalea euphylliae]REL28448.1 flagellin [Thalassotalea euphylliae]